MRASNACILHKVMRIGGGIYMDCNLCKTIHMEYALHLVQKPYEAV
jgi:hypothetical protein